MPFVLCNAPSTFCCDANTSHTDVVATRDSQERIPPIGSSVTDDSPIGNLLGVELHSPQPCVMPRSSSMILPTQTSRPATLARFFNYCLVYVHH